MEGGFIDGLNAALFNDVRVSEGRVVKNNFNSLRWMRLREAPMSHRSRNHRQWLRSTGVGEPPLARRRSPCECHLRRLRQTMRRMPIAGQLQNLSKLLYQIHPESPTGRLMTRQRCRCCSSCVKTYDSKGTKFGCGIGQCSACTVLASANAVRSCGRAACRCEGTVHHHHRRPGSRPQHLHPVRQATDRNRRSQCGYCQGDQILSAVAAFTRTCPQPQRRRQPAPPRDQHICTADHVRIRKAVKAAALRSKTSQR